MFDKYFEVFLADNNAGKEIHYRLRYQVYCLETSYEDPRQFPNGQEKDPFDERSAHFIVRARSTGEWIAAMRLVIGPLGLLPISRFATIDPGRLAALAAAPSLNDISSCAEVSRLCVVSGYRRRAQERNVPYQLPWTSADSVASRVLRPEQRKAPWLILGLVRAARDYCEENNIRYWFFLIAKALARIMEGVGMELELIGPECEHRGPRFPYLRDLARGFNQLPQKHPEIFRMLSQSSHYRLFSELEHDSYKVPVAL